VFRHGAESVRGALAQTPRRESNRQSIVGRQPLCAFERRDRFRALARSDCKHAGNGLPGEAKGFIVDGFVAAFEDRTAPSQRCRGRFSEDRTVFGRKTAELHEAAGQRDACDRRIGATSLERAPNVGEARSAEPPERGRTQECFEVAFEGTRAYAGDRREQVQVDRLRKVAAQPVERADKVGSKAAGVTSPANRSASGLCLSSLFIDYSSSSPTYRLPLFLRFLHSACGIRIVAGPHRRKSQACPNCSESP
jgi:hypothetical protein